MGVKIIERKYKNQFYPSSEATDWLLGNVGDWQRLELTFEVSIEFVGNQSETLTLDSTANTMKLNNGKTWQYYGFDIGDSCVLSWNVLLDPENDGSFVQVPLSFSFVIQNLYGDTLESATDFNFGQWTLVPTDRGNVKVADVKVFTQKEPEGLKFRYSHISNENYQSSNLNSFIDGTVTEFSFAGLNNLLPGVNALMNPDGLQSGMAIENCKIQKLGGTIDAEFVLGSVSGTPRLITQRHPLTAFIKKDFDIIAIPLNKISGTAQYQSVGANHLPISLSPPNTYLNAPSSYFFANNLTAGTKVFDIDLKFKIIAANDNSNSDKLFLYLYRYDSSGNYISKLELKNWPDASGLVNQTLLFNNLASITVNTGDKLCLALQYYHPAQVTGRYVDIQFNQCNLISLDNGNSNTIGYTYKLTCDFMLASIFEQISNLENNVAPSILFNAGSLTDNFELILYPEWNNPNTVIKNNLKHTERLGNTGWFNENFNGLDNNFIVESLKYTDTSGNVVDQLDYANPIIVEAEVSGIQNLSANSEFGLGFAWIPRNENDYKHKSTPYHQNLLINTARKYSDGSFNLNENNGSTIYQGNTFGNPRIDVSGEGGVMFIPMTSDKVKMKARFIPNADFVNFFNNKADNDRKYILWISVANHDLQINFSDRVSLLLDYNDMIKVIPPAGPLAGMTNRFIEHPRHEDSSGEPVYFGHIEDDILNRVTFKIDKTLKHMQQISFGYEVENTITGNTYTLENVSKNVSLFPSDSNGIQQISINDIRGFKLVSGNNKNWLKINREPSLDSGNDVGYKCFFGTKIRWEDWILRNGVPSEFFNGTLPNNGYHNNWLDYLRNSPDYKFNFFVEITVLENGELKNHKNTFELSFNGYDENLNIQTEHRYLRHSDNTLLNIGTDPSTGKPLGVILNNEPTRIEIIYTNLAGDFNFTKSYAVTSLEVDKGAGEFEYRQLSSVWLSEGDNPLIPLSGETKLKMELLAPNVIKTSCLVDGTLLEQVEKYKITGRIGCFKEGENQLPPFGLYEEIYSEIYQ